MTAFSLPCPSCHTVLTFAVAPAPGKSFRCPKCQTIFQAPAESAPHPALPHPRGEGREGGQPAARAAATKPAAARKTPAAQNAFSFVEEERIESANAPPRKQGRGCLIAAVFGFVFLLLGVGGGGYAALDFTGRSPPNIRIPASATLLIGRWDLKGSDPILYSEFHDDGTLVNGGGEQKMNGTWKLVDDSTLEVTLNVPGKEPMKRLLKIQLSKDQLTTTDPQGQSDVFQRPAP